MRRENRVEMFLLLSYYPLKVWRCCPSPSTPAYRGSICRTIRSRHGSLSKQTNWQCMYSHTISASIVKPHKGTNLTQSRRFNVVFDYTWLIWKQKYVCRNFLFILSIICNTVLLSKNNYLSSFSSYDPFYYYFPYLRWNSWTSVWQKTRVFCSLLFTVPTTGRITENNTLLIVLKIITKNTRNKKTWVYSWMTFCRTKKRG